MLFPSTLLLLLVLAYTWLGYPLILRLIAPRTSRSPHSPSNPLPPVAILLAAHNEAAHIRQRLENIFSLDYPSDRLAVHLGLDGCTDDTEAIARAIASSHPNIHIHAFPERRGKVAVLKDVVQAVTGSDTRHATRDTRHGSLLVFSDANTFFRPDALRNLVRHFNDPAIGGVCGRLIFKNSREKAQKTQKNNGCPNPRIPEFPSSSPLTPTHPHTHTPPLSPEGAYWDWETKLKIAESTLDSCIGANGAIYAMRPQLFWRDIPQNTLIDDLVLGVKVREQGFRLVYDPEAIAEEELPDVAHEWTRRVRIGAGAYQALRLCSGALYPHLFARADDGKLKSEIKATSPTSAFSFQLSAFLFPWMFWSHKILRWFTPHMLLLLLTLSIADMMVGVSSCAHPHTLTPPHTPTLTPPHTPTLTHPHTPTLSSLILLFFLAGGVARLLRRWNLPGFRLLDHFLTMQAALFMGFIRYCRGGLQGAWTRTPRE